MTADHLARPDLLPALLRQISLRERGYSRRVGCGDWQVNANDHARVSRYLIASGHCWRHLAPPTAPIALAAGELLFFTEDVWLPDFIRS